MTPELHLRIQEIFEAAIDLPRSRRAEYLDQACASDADLRARVEKLIETAEETATLGDPLEISHRSDSGVSSCPKCKRCYERAVSTCPQDQSALEFEFRGEPLIDGKYLVERCLGRGGMGTVYLAKHVGLEKRFALKLMLLPYAGFETEARALGTLKHANIVDVTDYGVDPRGGGMPYLVMEYLEGITVTDALKERPALPFPEAVVLLRSIASAIDYAHGHNPSVVHGDLKPSNLFLAKATDTSKPCLKVVDFGLAQLSQTRGADAQPVGATASRSTGSEGLRGTPAYMAPELFRYEAASGASDRYAFGALAYEVLAGVPPFGRTLEDVLNRVGNPAAAPSSRSSDLPIELDAPVMELLSREPKDRPSTASAAVSAMQSAWLKAEQRKWRASEGPRRLVIAAAAAALVILVAGLLVEKLPAGRAFEDRTADWRWALVPQHAPDPRLVVVALDEEAYDAGRQSLGSEWDGEFARMVDRLFDAGARSVAIDVTLPRSWSQSAEFRQAVIRHAGHLALGLRSEPSGGVVGADCISPLTARIIGTAYDTLFSFVNIEEDDTRTVRRGRVSFIDIQGLKRRSFAERAVDAAYPAASQFDSARDWFWIDASVRSRDIPWIPWKEVPARLASAPDLFRDRLVIAGANFAEDRHRVPPVPVLVPGVLVQAVIANTILTGLPVRGAGLLPSLAAAGVACFAIIAAALRFPHRYAWCLIASVGLLCGYAALAFWMLRSSRTMIALTAPEFTIALGAAAGWGLKSRLIPYPVERIGG
jgi:CHASE2 domain-containing sensor protein